MSKTRKSTAANPPHQLSGLRERCKLASGVRIGAEGFPLILL